MNKRGNSQGKNPSEAGDFPDFDDHYYTRQEYQRSGSKLTKIGEPEYWSPAAMKERSLSEMYPTASEDEIDLMIEEMVKAENPKKEYEGDILYEERLRPEIERLQAAERAARRQKSHKLGEKVNEFIEFENSADQGYKFERRGKETFLSPQTVGIQRLFKNGERTKYEIAAEEEDRKTEAARKAEEEARKAEAVRKLELKRNEIIIASGREARDHDNPSHIRTIREIKTEYRAGTQSVEDHDKIVAYYREWPRTGGKRRGLPGIFYHLGDKVDQNGEPVYYSQDDLSYVLARRKDFEGGENDAFRADGRRFEGLFYPLVESGIFNRLVKIPSELGHKIETLRAESILTSEYDDYRNATDAAILMPLLEKGKNGEVVIEKMPMAFDLTVARPSAREQRGRQVNQEESGKYQTIAEDFRKHHGFCSIKYPFACRGAGENGRPLLRKLTGMNEVPHFVIALPWGASEASARPVFHDFCVGILNPKEGDGYGTVPGYIKDSINFEIFIQAARWNDYYTTSGETKKAHKFGLIAENFGRELAKSGRRLEDIQRDNVAAAAIVNRLSRVENQDGSEWDVSNLTIF